MAVKMRVMENVSVCRLVMKAMRIVHACEVQTCLCSSCVMHRRGDVSEAKRSRVFGSEGPMTNSSSSTIQRAVKPKRVTLLPFRMIIPRLATTGCIMKTYIQRLQCIKN